MNAELTEKIARAYGWHDLELNDIGTGLINATWKARTKEGDFILQRINTHVFSRPDWIDENLRMLNGYFSQHAPGYLFTAPVLTTHNTGIVTAGEDHYRAFPFIDGSRTIDVVGDASQACEAAAQFGRFTALLEGFNAQKLHLTLKDFHNLTLRYHQFEAAANNGHAARWKQSADVVSYIRLQRDIVKKYEAFITNPEARTRVMHHDTKIGNVLFDADGRGLCVIDLDTVMPGYFFSDVGDMFRTYVSPVSEEERDIDRIRIRPEIVKAIENGYLSSMKSVLTSFETDHFYFSGEILIYMQAIRFITDYLNNDVYYGSKYEGHNLVRTRNQVRLLQLFRQSYP